MTLYCKAAGFPPPIITWYKDGQVIAEEKRQFKKRKLEIKKIQFEDRGIYTCTAENLLGRVQLSVNVTVEGKLLINSTEDGPSISLINYLHLKLDCESICDPPMGKIRCWLERLLDL